MSEKHSRGSLEGRQHESKTGHESKTLSTPFFPGLHSNSVLPELSNRNVEPDITEGNVFAKIPVVIGETKVQIDVDTIINFPEPVLEIKAIKKNLKIVQCRLLTPTNKLFIKGFVRKNIQYATPTAATSNSVLSNIRSLTIDIPFTGVTAIDFLNNPKFQTNPDTKNFTFFTESQLPKGFSPKEHLLSGDLSQFDQLSGEHFNELPFCELIESRFIEFDEALDRQMGRVLNARGEVLHSPFEEGTFTRVEEKMVIELTVKVLQNQQVNVKSQKKHC
ncbi:CsxC family protein [Bacillus sp. OTU530]|uniref:CsxC family protein n=1 Tax=Bacillus sp. OTU530 TaxID=3043862 RepID=UPI00313D5CF6